MKEDWNHINQLQEEHWKTCKCWKLNNMTLSDEWVNEIKKEIQKIPWNTWKWGHTNTKSVEYWENNLNREIHIITGLSQKKKKKKLK